MTQKLNMQFEKLIQPDSVHEECVIVIDVLRAFTTAAYAFGAGASKMIAVSTIEEAQALKKQNPDFLLTGELHGIKIDGFDFSNSPYEMQQHNLSERTLIQRTSAGSQGVVRSKGSKHIIPASFVVAEATYQRILQINPAKVTFLITGKEESDEDLALADYLEQKLILQKPIDPQPFLQRIAESPLGKKFQEIGSSNFYADLQQALLIDRFSFFMEVKNETTIYHYFLK